jgi:20S proteasome alpha/beta subunit
MSKRMTLVIGALCENGMVFCSDTEEGTVGGGKRPVRKLFEFSGDDWQMVIATAGFGPLCDVAIKRIDQKTKTHDFLNDHDTLAELYRQYIWPFPDWKQQDREISLVLGVINRQAHERFLYQTKEEIVQPIQHQFACAGVGQEIAFYLLDRFFDASLQYVQGEELLSFVMREAKESFGNVGGNTEPLTIPNDVKGTLQRKMAPGWEAKQPYLWQCIDKFWLKH